MNIKVKRGQLNISFGAIFSIIIIVAILAVAGYVIYKFVKGADSVNCGRFYTDLNDKVETAYSSDGEASYPFSYNVPSKTQKVCFGLLSLPLIDEKDRTVYDFLKRSINTDNFFIYPQSACGDSKYRYTIKNANTNEFFCLTPTNGKVTVKITKEIGGKVILSKM
jgi:hypothetical protein